MLVIIIVIFKGVLFCVELEICFYDNIWFIKDFMKYLFIY